jgi:undecaprenyl diphosphate synthase
MPGHPLRHLAIIADAAAASAAAPEDLVLAALNKAAEISHAAFGTIPALQAFSFHAPGLERHLDTGAAAGPVLQAWIEGARALRGAAAELHAALRLCGRVDELPDALRRAVVPEAAPHHGKSLLWFLRYGGRDEIARAAARFFRERPGAMLDDDELDAWLDTAGVPDPDLLLYVGGELEPRDALLWQGSYAEISHTRAAISSFTAADLQRAVLDYFDRQRRFGR